MAYSYLLLGPVLFQNFELPTSINWGGTQSLNIHRLPGGARVIDAMGRNDAEISWTGIFSGSESALRARAIDLMRADGSLWPLTWDSYFYSVIVSNFEADYRRPNWIPYRIACTVLRDEAEAVVQTALSIIGGVMSDLTAADSLGTGLDLQPLTASFAVIGATTRGTSSYAQVKSQMGTTTDAANIQLATTGTQLTSATNLSQASTLAGQTAQLAAARGYLQRASVNLANASS